MDGPSRSSRRWLPVFLVLALVGGLLSLSSTTHAVMLQGKLNDKDASEFKTPWSVATDEFGDVYVSDTGKHRISKWNGTSRELEWIAGSYGSGDNQLYVPQGMAIADGVVYVADTLNHRIAKFSASDGEWLGSIVGQDEPLAYPADVDYGNDLLYVAEGGAECRVLFLRQSGNSWGAIGSAGGCGSQRNSLSSPMGVAVTDSEIFVADGQLGVVKKYNLTGGFLGTIGSPGSERGQLDGPYALAVTKSDTGGTHVWVIEAGSTSRAQKFTGDGAVVEVVGGTNKGGHFTFPHGLALSPDGRTLWIADSGAENPTVYKFLDTEPKLLVVVDEQLKRMVNTEGLWFHMAYNQETKSCNVLVKATVSVPGHPKFTVEDDFKVKNVTDEYKVDVSGKQAKWLKSADNKNKKVPISATFTGKCSEGVRVTAREDYKAG